MKTCKDCKKVKTCKMKKWHDKNGSKIYNCKNYEEKK